MQFEELVTTRRSVKTYDPKHSIGDDELSALFEKVALSPSSFNLQFWRFVVVRDAETRAKLREASWNQEHVGTCSAVIVVAGKLTAYKDAAEIFAESPENVREALLPTIAGFYENNPQAQREEAIRSTSLAAMTLMLAASDMGYATCPMIGFDPAKVSEIVGLDEEHIPVMLVVLGKETGTMRPRAFRFPLDRFVKLESMNGKGLE